MIDADRVEGLRQLRKAIRLKNPAHGFNAWVCAGTTMFRLFGPGGMTLGKERVR